VLKERLEHLHKERQVLKEPQEDKVLKEFQE
jgi:hypothetical protein